MTQNEMILTDLKRGFVLTPNFALREYGCARLAARIHELRQEGHNIMKGKRPFKSRKTGKSGYIACYWLPVHDNDTRH